jgi:hypothetical protein
MRYRLRTLLIVLALGPPMLASLYACLYIALQDYIASWDFIVPEVHLPPPDGLGPLVP